MIRKEKIENYRKEIPSPESTKNFETQFWKWVFYLSWSIVMLWIILKSTGIIHTPFWLEYGVPLAGVGFALLSIYQDLIKTMHAITVQTAILTTRYEYHDKEIEHLKTRFAIK